MSKPKPPRTTTKQRVVATFRRPTNTQGGWFEETYEAIGLTQIEKLCDDIKECAQRVDRQVVEREKAEAEAKMKADEG